VSILGDSMDPARHGRRSAFRLPRPERAARLGRGRRQRHFIAAGLWSCAFVLLLLGVAALCDAVIDPGNPRNPWGVVEYVLSFGALLIAFLLRVVNLGLDLDAGSASWGNDSSR
jgi:hypothetical protein